MTAQSRDTKFMHNCSAFPVSNIFTNLSEWEEVKEGKSNKQKSVRETRARVNVREVEDGETDQVQSE